MNRRFFRRLHQLVLYEIRSFEDQLQHLRSRDYPTAAGTELIDELLSEIGSRRQAVEQIVSEFDRDPTGTVERLQSEHRKITFLFNGYTVALENARTLRVPWELVPAIEDLAAVLNPGHRLLVSCTDAFNYEIQWRPGPSKAGVTSFDRLVIPSIHRFDALLHVLVGHELFHPVLDEFFQAEQSRVMERLRDGCEKILPPDPNNPLFESKRLDQWVEFARTVWLRALEEIMCDMGCVALFGPAALAASWSFALGRSLDQQPTAPSYYPPWRFRIRALAKFGLETGPGKVTLDNLISILKADGALANIGQTFVEHLADVSEITKGNTDMVAINLRPLLKIAYEQVTSSLDAAWGYIQKRADSTLQTWQRSYEQVPSLLRALSMFVPPSEIRSDEKISGPAPATSAVIIAVWLFHLSKEAQAASPEQLAVEYDRCCKLLLKALGDSQLKQKFSAAAAKGEFE